MTSIGCQTETNNVNEHYSAQASEHCRKIHRVQYFTCHDVLPTYKCKCKYETYFWKNIWEHRNGDESKNFLPEVLFCNRCNFRTYSSIVLMKHGEVHETDANETTFDNSSFQERHKLQKYLGFLKGISSSNLEWLKCGHGRCGFLAEVRGDAHHAEFHSTANADWFGCTLCVFNIRQIIKLKNHIMVKHNGADFLDNFDDL